MRAVNKEHIYYVGATREYTSLTRLFLDLAEDEAEKTIYVDPGVYDVFREYKEAGIQSPPDDVTVGDYFSYNVFLPLNTKLIGIGNVRLEFSPSPDEITYAESRTWAPLNVTGACYIENIEIYCKNGRYCIHDDCHNKYQNVNHYYKHVRCFYELGDTNEKGQLLGLNNTIGFGFAQGCKFEFDDCTLQFIGEGNYSAFYGHETGWENPLNAPSLILRNCLILGSESNSKVLRLQNLAKADLHILTRIESCYILGGIYLTIFGDKSAQRFDVTLINSGNPPQLIDKAEENKYPIKVFNAE